MLCRGPRRSHRSDGRMHFEPRAVGRIALPGTSKVASLSTSSYFLRVVLPRIVEESSAFIGDKVFRGTKYPQRRSFGCEIGSARCKGLGGWKEGLIDA